MKKNIYRSCGCAVSALFAILILSSIGYADLGEVGQKNPQASMVASLIRSAGEMGSSSDQYKSKMDEYDRQSSKCASLTDPTEQAKCREQMKVILDEAKVLLQKLNQQADSVESRISTARANKSMDAKHLRKLDSVLASVKTMRAEANRRMENASRPA